jgi:hypothetical protein
MGGMPMPLSAAVARGQAAIGISGTGTGKGSRRCACLGALGLALGGRRVSGGGLGAATPASSGRAPAEGFAGAVYVTFLSCCLRTA